MNKIAQDDLPVIHLVLNTDCNAFTLQAPPDSPGTCRFCYRETNRVISTEASVRAIISDLRHHTEAKRIVFTGGDPLMPYDNYVEVALFEAKAHGFETNLHTNGIQLAERYPKIREAVDVYTLPIDGHDATTSDWFRGTGYFDLFWRNIKMLAVDRQTIGINTFTAPHSIDKLHLLAEQIHALTATASVEYWLISQYRPIGRSSLSKKLLYGYDPAVFTAAVQCARAATPGLTIFEQPTRAPGDPYPLRVWVLGDGEVTADVGTATSVRNMHFGNGLAEGFDVVIRRALAARSESGTHLGSG